ncbi:MAG TPA: class I SAM-dependent RNA methyltransferase [Hyphomicrobium sp.]|nr:class I SAM-dependent RNA methyltransferase [Hyphomicrobium sp.]
MATEFIEVEISRVGAQGDGMANASGETIFIPFALAGERVRVSVLSGRAELIEVLQPSGDRVTPVCHHFGKCGGCALQHMASATYADWKRDQVIAAFRARAIDADVAPVFIPAGQRRRTVLTARRTDDDLHLGFHAAQSHDLIDIAECPVLEPRIIAAFAGLKRMLKPLINRRGEARATVTLTGAGLDVAVSDTDKALTIPLRSAIAKDAAALGLARFSIDSDPVYEALPPFLTFGGIDVRLPPGIFIQAVGAAEAEMARLVVDGLGKVKSVVDLFAGIGALTFPIAARAKVLAVDSEKTAIAALSDGVRKGSGIKPVTTLVRDLFREPLSALELNEHDAVVFDPPRAGAEAQARMLARSKVKTVVAVSCNPATLARDARILIDGGYKMGRVTPIDQFHYTPHIEAVVAFKR